MRAFGAQQRLNNLHYAAGPEDGQLTAESQAALRAFQGDAGIPRTGQVDDATVAALRSVYGH
jgi:peptidoglycan hydrolase-like protein with peptidoglycan-binding domain